MSHRKGIIHFNDACDKRHVDVSRVQAELQETERQVRSLISFTGNRPTYHNRFVFLL